MKLHNLKPAKGSTKKDKRIGRGEASGHGGTSTKGNKGGQAVPVTKANWDMKVARCQSSDVSPSVDFKNNNRIEYKVFNLGQIEQIIEKYGITEFQPGKSCSSTDLINRTDKVKILGNGELKSKLGFQGERCQRKSQSSH